MPDNLIRGKSLAAVAADLADGFIYLNPLVLKDFANESCKDLFYQLKKLQTEIRTEKFPSHDPNGIRKRNLRLQRLHQAIVVLQNNARVKRIPL
jgi:hypothetical protein